MNPFNGFLLVGVATTIYAFYNLTIWPPANPVSPEVDWVGTGVLLVGAILVIGGVVGRLAFKPPAQVDRAEGLGPRDDGLPTCPHGFLLVGKKHCPRCTEERDA